MQYGSKVAGRLVPIDPNVQRLSEPQGIYEILIQTEDIPDEQMAIQQLLTLEKQFEDLRVLYVETVGNDIRMQIIDMGPGAWSLWGIASLIPVILVSVLIIVVGLGIWQIVSMNPIILFLVILGGIALVITTAGVKIPTPKQIRTETKDKLKGEGTEAADANLEQTRISASNQLSSATKRYQDAEKDLRGEFRKKPKNRNEELIAELKAEKAKAETAINKATITLDEVEDLLTELAKMRIEKERKKR